MPTGSRSAEAPPEAGLNESLRRLAAKQSALQLRGQVLAVIRRFFAERGYLEVQTPVRIPAPAIEPHIVPEASGDQWLRTSPELEMKRMVCAGYDKIYQIGPCFRRGERGAKHRPEYTMLEWYCVGATARDLELETCALLRAVCAELGRSVFSGVDLAAAPWRLRVGEAFWLWAGWDPVAAFDEDRFDLDMVEQVEPHFAEAAVPVILSDFPAPRAALARRHPEDPQVAERWELYLNGLELANAYTELTDVAEQRERFAAAMGDKSRLEEPLTPMPEAFLSALAEGMPACAGIALGLDRLLMILLETDDIADVMAFAP